MPPLHTPALVGTARVGKSLVGIVDEPRVIQEDPLEVYSNDRPKIEVYTAEAIPKIDIN